MACWVGCLPGGGTRFLRGIDFLQMKSIQGKEMRVFSKLALDLISGSAEQFC